MSNFNNIVTATQLTKIDPNTNLPTTTPTVTTDTGNRFSAIHSGKLPDIYNEPYSQREVLPDTYASYKGYLPTIVYGTDVDEQRAQAQGWSGKLGNTLISAVPITLSKAGQLFGVVAGAAGTLFTMPYQLITEGKVNDKGYSMLFDNAVIDMFDETEKYFKDSFPIYQQNQYKYGTSWDKMWTSDYWATDVADGLEFMASAWLGGFITKPLQAGGMLLKGTKLGNLVEASTLLAKSGKAGIGARALSKWDLGVITTYNTVGEAGIEGRGVYKSLMEDYAKGVWGKDLTEEQAKKKASESALRTFAFNTAVLAIPNFIETSWFWGSNRLNKEAIKAAVAGDKIAGSYISKMAKNAGIGIISEGAWEEGSQSAIANYETLATKVGDDEQGLLGHVGGIISEYAKGFSRTEDQMAMITGAIIGGLGGSIGGLREASAERAALKSITKLMNISDPLFNKNFQSLYKTFKVSKPDVNPDGTPKVDASGNPIMKEEDTIINPTTGKPEINQEAVVSTLYDILYNKTLMDEATAAQIAGNDVAANTMKNLALARLVKFYMDTDKANGTNYALDVLSAKLDLIAENAPAADKSEIMQELARNKEVIVKLEKVFREAKSNTKLNLSNVKERQAFDSKRENAEVLQRMKLMTLEEERQRIVGLPQTTPAEQAAVASQLAKIDALIQDTNDSINQLTKDQDALFTDYQSEQKNEETINEKIKEVEEKEKKINESLVELYKDATKNAAEIAAKEKEKEDLSVETEAWVVSKEVEHGTNELRDTFNISDLEVERLSPTYKQEKLKYSLLKKLGRNMFIMQEALKMKSENVPTQKIMEFLANKKVTPTPYVLGIINDIQDTQDIVEKMAYELGIKIRDRIRSLIDTLENKNASSSELERVLGAKYIKDLIDKAKNHIDDITDFEHFVLSKLEKAYTKEGKSGFPDISSIALDFPVHRVEDTVLGNASALTSLNNMVSSLILHTTTAPKIDYDALAKQLESLIELHKDMIDAGIPADVIDIDNIKTDTIALLEFVNYKGIDALKNKIIYNVDATMIRRLLTAPLSEHNAIMEYYFLHKEERSARSFVQSVNREEFSDVDSIYKYLLRLKGMKKFISTSTNKSLLPISVDIDNTISELEALLDIATKNKNNKTIFQIKAFFRERDKFGYTLGGKFKYDAATGEQTFVVENSALSTAILNVIKSSISKHEFDIFEKMLQETGRENDMSFLHDFIFQYVLRNADKTSFNVVILNVVRGLNDALRVIYPDMRGDVTNPIMTLVESALITNQSKTLDAAGDNNFRLKSKTYIMDNPNSFLNRFIRTRDFPQMISDLKNDAELKAMFPNPADFDEFVKETIQVINILEQINYITEVYNQHTTEVVAMRQKENTILEEERKDPNGVIPTMQQLFSIRSIVSRINRKLSRNDGTSHLILLNGTLGTGKTSVVPKWVMKMLGITGSQVMSFGHNANTSRQIAQITGSAESSVDKFFNETIPDGIRLVIVDEIHALSGEDLNKIVNKLKKINATRAENNRLYVLGLGDTFQNIKGTELLPPLYMPLFQFTEIGAATSTPIGSKAHIFEAMPLTVRYRSAVSAINNFVDHFYGNTKEVDVSKISAGHNMDATKGVVKHNKKEDVVDALKSSTGNTAIIVSNKADLDEYKKLLEAAKIAYYDLNDPAHNDYKAGQKVQLYMYEDANGVTVDTVYVDVKRGDFKDTYKYNTAMYTSIGRARTLASVNLPLLNTVPDARVGEVSIEEEVEAIKNTMIEYKAAERKAMDAFNVAPAATKTAAKTTPPVITPPVTTTTTTTPVVSGISSVPPDETIPDIVEVPTDESEEVTYDGLILGELDTIGELEPEHPTARAMAAVNSNEVVLISDNGFVYVLEKVPGQPNLYIALATLGRTQVADLINQGKLPANTITNVGDINLALKADRNGVKTFEIKNEDNILAKGTVVKKQLIAFRYDKTRVTASGEDLIAKLRPRLEKALGPIDKMEYVLYTDTGDNAMDRDPDYVRATSETKRVVNAGFPYIKVVTKDNQVFFINAPARVLNKNQDSEIFDVINTANAHIEKLEAAFSKHAIFRDGEVKLGHMLFNLIINRLHTVVNVAPDGVITTFDPVTDKSKVVNSIADYLYDTDVEFIQAKMKLFEKYKKVFGIDGIPDTKQEFIDLLSDSDLFNVLATDGVALMQMYYGIQSESISVDVSKIKTDDRDTYLAKRLEEIKTELGTSVNTDSYAFVVGRNPNEYFLRIGNNDTDPLVKVKKFKAEKGPLQKLLNKLALANKLMDNNPFTVKITASHGAKSVVAAKGFLSMSETSGMATLAKRIRLYQLKSLGVNSSVWIDDVTIDEIFKELEALHNRITTSVAAYRTERDSENIRRESAGVRKLEDRPDDYLEHRIQELKFLWAEIQTQIDAFRSNPNTVTHPITSDMLKTLSETDGEGNSKSNMRVQLNVTEFKANSTSISMDAPDKATAQEYFNDNLVDTLEVITPTSLHINLDAPVVRTTTAPSPKPSPITPTPPITGWNNEELLANLPSTKTGINDSPVRISNKFTDKVRYIPFSIIEEANKGDAHGGQSAREIVSRGGYSDKELDTYYPDWRKKVAELNLSADTSIADDFGDIPIGKDLVKSTDAPLGDEITLDQAYQMAKKLIPTIQPWEVEGHLRLLTNEGSEAFGRMVNGIVQLELSKEGKVRSKVLLHEIFHKIWNYYLTEEEKRAVEKIVRKEYGDINDIEEYLAIMYQKSSPTKQSLLSWLWNKILKFFGHVNRNHHTIQSLFDNIYNGMYSTPVSAPAGISRNMVKIEEQFGGMGVAWKVANTQLGNALGYLSSLHNVTITPMQREELAIKAYRHLLGDIDNVNIQSVPVYETRLTALKAIKELATKNNTRIQLAEAVKLYTKDIVDKYNTAKRSKNSAEATKYYYILKQLLQDEMLILNRANGGSFEVNPNYSLFKGSIVPQHDAFNTYIESQELQLSALKYLLVPSTFAELMKDYDKSLNTNDIIYSIKKGIEEAKKKSEEAKKKSEEEEDDDANLIDPVDSLENENTWNQILKQIVDDEKLNKENNLTMTTRIFLANLFEVEYDATTGLFKEIRDANGFRKTLNPRHSFAQLINVFNEVDFLEINEATDPLKKYRDQISKVTRKLGTHKGVLGILNELDKLVSLVFSAHMDSGKQHTGFFRFLDPDTFVYTLNPAKNNVLFREYESIKRKEVEGIKVVGLPQVTEAELRADKDFVIIKKPSNKFADTWLQELAAEMDTKTVRITRDGQTTTHKLFETVTGSRIINGVSTQLKVGNTFGVYRDPSDPSKTTPQMAPVFSGTALDTLNKTQNLNFEGASLTIYALNDYYRRMMAQNTYVTVMNTFGNLVLSNFHFVERQNKRGAVKLVLRTSGKMTISKAVQSTVAMDLKNVLSKPQGNTIFNTVYNTHKNKKYSELFAAAVSALESKDDDKIKSAAEALGLSDTTSSGLLRKIKDVNKVFGFNSKIQTQVFEKIKSIDNQSLQLMHILQELGMLKPGTVLKDDNDLSNKILDDIVGFTDRLTALKASVKNTTNTIVETSDEATDTTDLQEEGINLYNVLLEDSKGLISNIADMMILDVDSERSTSVFGADKTRKYTANSRSHLKNVLQQLAKSAISLEYLDANASETTKSPTELRSLFFKFNYLLKNRSAIVRSHKNSWKEHDSFKYNENFVIDYADESPSLWLERVVMAGFFGGIRSKNVAYDHYVWTVSNKRSMHSLQLGVLNPTSIKASLKSKLEQIQNRNINLSTYVATFDVVTFHNLGVLQDLIEEGNALAVKFRDSLKDESVKITSSELSSLADLMYTKLSSITDLVYDSIVSNAIPFPSNINEIVSALAEAKIITLTDAQKEVQLPARFTKYDTTLRRSEYISLDDAQKEILKMVLDVFVKNYYVNSYDLNQLIAGDFAFFKDPFDVIKRYSGMAAYGIAPLLPTITGRTVRVLMGSDLSRTVDLDVFKGTKVEGLLGKSTDSQLFMLPRRLQQLQRAMGTDYKLDVVTKPALYGMSKVKVPIGTNAEGKTVFRIEYVPVMLKASGISLEDSICLIDESKGNVPDNWTPLGFLRHNMEQLDTPEYIFVSGVKTGAPSKAYTADTNRMFTEEDYHAKIAPDIEYFSREVNNVDYRFQFNPASDVDSKVPNFTQLPYFLNILQENTVSSRNVYAYMAKLFANGLAKVKEDNTEVDENNSDLTKLDRKAINAIQSQGSERVRELLDYGVSKTNPALATKFLNHLISHVSKATIKIKFPGSKLILQTAAGMRIKGEPVGSKRRLEYKTETYVDSNGKEQTRIYAEAIVPAIYKDTVALGDFLYSDLLAVRIPTSEIHSAIPLRVVGFYDTKNSNVIVVPEEMVPLQGADFDVDSLFVIRRETFDSNKQVAGYYDYVEKLQSLKAQREKVTKYLKSINDIITLVGANADSIEIIQNLFDKLDGLLQAGRNRYNAALNSDSFDTPKFEKDFKDWLNSGKHPSGKDISLGVNRDGTPHTILTWAISKFGTKFDLNILRFSFSEQYRYSGDKRIAWRRFDDTHAWTNVDEENTIYNKFQEGIAKGTVGERGRWVPIVPKDDAIESTIAEIEGAFSTIPNVIENANIKDNIMNYVRASNFVTSAAEKRLAEDDKLSANDPNKLTEEQRNALIIETEIDLKNAYKKAVKNLRFAINDVRADMATLRDSTTPVGYIRTEVEVIENGKPVKKEKWILNPNFEQEYSAEAELHGLSKKQTQRVLSKYYKNVIVESMLEVITAEKNKGRMFSPIMLFAFNEETDDTAKNGLYKEGTIFRTLQNIILKAKGVDLQDTSLSNDALKRLVRLKNTADMSNVLNALESFKSNFEGASLVGVFANEMRAIAYMVKGGFTFYSAYKNSIETLTLDGDTFGKDSKIPEKIKDLSVKINALVASINDKFKDNLDAADNVEFNEAMEELSKMQTEYVRYLRKHVKPSNNPITLKVERLVPNGEEVGFIAPKLQKDNIVIAGRTYNRIQDNVDNWIMFDALLNAAIDNVKEQILPIINGNKFTANALAAALMMGMPMDKIAVFLNQPIIRKMSEFSTGSVENRIIAAERYYKSLLDAPLTDEESKVDVTDAQLEEGYIAYHNQAELNREEIIAQLAVLREYKKLSKVGQDLFTLSRAVSIIRDMPVFVDEIMNNADDWTALGEFDSEYNFTPNPSFSFSLSGWLDRLPHIVEAVKIRDTVMKKIEDEFYMHSPDFTKIIDNLHGLPKSIPEEGANRNKVARRFEAIKFISSGLYNSLVEAPYTYSYTTMKGKESEATLVGGKAFSQRFLKKLVAVKEFARTNSVPEELNVFLRALEVDTNRYGEYYVRYSLGTNANYADIIDAEAGFNMLKNLDVSILNDGSIGVRKVTSETDDFTPFQREFVKYAALNYGVSMGTTNFTAIINKKLIKEFDDMLKTYVEALKRIKTEGGTMLEEVVDLFEIEFVANYSSNLKFVERGIPAHKNILEDDTVEYSGIDNLEGGQKVFYDLKFTNVYAEDTQGAINDAYPEYIIFGTYNMAYKRVYVGVDYVYYQLIGKNHSTLYGLHKDVSYNKEEYFSPSVVTYFTNSNMQSMSTNDEITLQEYNRPMPSYINEGDKIFVTTKRDSSRQYRIPVVVKSKNNNTMTVKRIPLSELVVTPIESVPSIETVLITTKSVNTILDENPTAKFIIPTNSNLSTSKGVASELVKRFKNNEGKKINVYYGSQESADNTRILSNLAPRTFKYKDPKTGTEHTFYSVEHAYQVLKSGTFNTKTDAAYRKLFQNGALTSDAAMLLSAGEMKIRSQRVDKTDDYNLKLLTDLVKQSLLSQPKDSAVITKLLEYDTFTHNQKETTNPVDRAFIKGLYEAQKELGKQPEGFNIRDYGQIVITSESVNDIVHQLDAIEGIIQENTLITYYLPIVLDTKKDTLDKIVDIATKHPNVKLMHNITNPVTYRQFQSKLKKATSSQDDHLTPQITC